MHNSIALKQLYLISFMQYWIEKAAVLTISISRKKFSTKMYQTYCTNEIWLVNIVCKTSQRNSLKKRAGLIHRTVLRECNIVNLPNNTKQHKMLKKWDKRTVPYYSKRNVVAFKVLRKFLFPSNSLSYCHDIFLMRNNTWNLRLNTSPLFLPGNTPICAQRRYFFHAISNRKCRYIARMYFLKEI